MDAAQNKMDIKKMLPESRSIIGLSEAELLDRARAERATIVSKYEHGRHMGQEDVGDIPPWEDPQYEDYHVTDKWGFIHDTRLPEIHTKEEEKSIEVEANRMLKWTKMTKSWDKYHGATVKHRAGGNVSNKHIPAHHQVSDKLYNRIYKGIPASFRGHVWSKLLNLDAIKQEQSGKYQEMKVLGCKWSPDVRQIDLDVNRTFRDNIMFRKRYDVKQQQLFYMLVAYSVYNQEIGYCQGMSQIAALLLMFMDEEDAFWALSSLMADLKYAMHGFFIHGFPKLLRFQEHHNKILTHKLPNLFKHLQRNCIDAGLYTLKWFFQCFLDRVPFPLCLRLWDIYILEGERLLTAAAYTILKLHRRSIQHLDMDKILDFLQKKLAVDFGMPDDEVIASVRRSLDELRRAKLEHPGPPPLNELPSVPFGTFVEPSIAAEVGMRAEPDDHEKRLTLQLIEQQEKLQRCSLENQGSHTSLDQSIDEVSSTGADVAAHGVSTVTSATGGISTSLAGYGSRVSLANTSLTSAPDLSTLSSITLARRNEPDLASISSDKMPVSGLSGSRRSLESPDRKSVQSFLRSSRSPPVSRDGISASGGTDSSSLSAAADSGLGSYKRSRSHSRDSKNRSNSSQTASSHPHLSTSLQNADHIGVSELVSSPRTCQSSGEDEILRSSEYRRSVQSDDGYYDQSADSIPYTNLSRCSTGDDREDLDSDCEFVHANQSGEESPVDGRGTERPGKLSVSQTTLVRDPDAFNSEPATPRAGETPDTVRLYVPYSINGELASLANGPGTERNSSALIEGRQGENLREECEMIVENTLDKQNLCEDTNSYRDDDPFRIKIQVKVTPSSLSSLNMKEAIVENNISKHNLNHNVNAKDNLSSLPSIGGGEFCSSNSANVNNKIFAPKNSSSLHKLQDDTLIDIIPPKVHSPENIATKGFHSSLTQPALENAPNIQIVSEVAQCKEIKGRSLDSTQLPREIDRAPKRLSETESSPVQVKIFSYYETKHYRSRSTADTEALERRNINAGEWSKGRVQHYNMHRQSSTSPTPPASPASQSYLPRDDFLQQQTIDSSEISNLARTSHRRNFSDHSSRHGYTNSSLFSSSDAVNSKVHVRQSQISSSVNTLSEQKFVASTSSYQSKIIDRANKQPATSALPKQRQIPVTALFKASESQYIAARTSTSQQSFKHFIQDEPLVQKSPECSLLRSPLEHRASSKPQQLTSPITSPKNSRQPFPNASLTSHTLSRPVSAMPTAVSQPKPLQTLFRSYER